MSETDTALVLLGKRILVTRTREQASVFSERLRILGAQPIEFPTIRIVPPDDWRELDAALKRLYSSGEPVYDWAVFTSVNGVRICFERLRTLGYDPQALQRTRIATIGPATAAALAEYGLHAALVPDEYIAESVMTALVQEAQSRGKTLAGERILLARAAEARRVLVTALREVGALVDEVPAYYTRMVAHDDEQGQAVMQLLQAHQLDILTFTSSSTVRNFVAWLKACEQSKAESLLALFQSSSSPIIACIGPITSQTARELGLPVHVEAEAFTIDGLVEALRASPKTLLM